MRAIFLDRDGVINEVDGFLTDINKIKIIPNSDKAIKILNKLGFKVIIVTNQSQIARGMLTEYNVNKINQKIKSLLEKKGAKIDAIYYCPHHPETHHKDIKPWFLRYRIDCDCRKPKIGMLKKAQKKFKIDFSKSFMIGDRTVDIETGRNAGCKTILVKTGHGGEDKKYNIIPDYIADDLFEASKIIENNMHRLKAVIIAGGKGERMRPLTEHTPKPMLLVGGKPILEHQIDELKKVGVKDIIICGHYLFWKIRQYFGDGSRFGVNITYCNEEIPLDTGGALKNTEPFIESTFVMIYGDHMLKMDLKKLVEFHKKKKAMVTCVLHRVDYPKDCELVKINKDSRIVKYYRRPHKTIPSNLAKSSLYVLEKEIFKYVSKDRHSFDLDDLPRLIKNHRIYGYVTKEFIRDVGTMERYKKINELWGEKK